ncbi:MAG: MurT ligase domain-containing protein [Candidatus Coprovivens sp.]
MKLSILIMINKLVTWVCKLFRRNGSVYPGFIIYDVLRQKKVLESVKYPKYVIAITGSSGKGSTTQVLYNILTKCGYDVCYNKNGSNGVLAATTLILNNCNIKGEFKHDVLLLECDERHLKLIFGKNKMTHLAITNVTRDQPARNGHPDIVFKDILSALDNTSTLIINSDDPMLNKLKYERKNEVVTYGIEKNDDSYKVSSLNCLDNMYCPLCHKKLNYEYYHYGHIGNYSCPSCEFKRGNVDYDVTDIDYSKNTMKINGKKVYLNKGVIYAVYSIVCAYSIARSMGISDDEIVKVMNENKFESKRGKVQEIDGRKITMLESKNENNLSYYQSMKFIKNQKGKKTIILGFDNVSRRYGFNDLSWLWDVDFEMLNDKTIDKIFIIGRFRYDVLTRLEFANIDKEKLVLIDDLDTVIKKVKKESLGDIYTMVCFDMTAILLKLIKEENHENI